MSKRCCWIVAALVVLTIIQTSSPALDLVSVSPKTPNAVPWILLLLLDDESIKPTQTIPEVPSYLQPGGPLIARNALRYGNSVSHAPQTQGLLGFQPGPPNTPADGFQGPGAAPGPAETGCTAVEVRNLSGSDLIEYLTSHSRSCLMFLWYYDTDVEFILSDSNLMTVVAEIETLAPAYSGSNENGLEQLLFFVRVAYYHQFYQPLTIGSSVTSAAISAFDALSTNAHLHDFNSEAGAILYQYINVIDAAYLAYNYLSLYKDTLRAFLMGQARWEDYNQRSIAFSVLFSIQRNAHQNDFGSRVDQELIDLLKAYATNLDFVPNYTFLVNNAIWALGRIAQIDEHRDAAVAALSEALATHPELSESYLWVVKALTEYADCQTSNPNVSICMEDVIPLIEPQLFPNSFVFDDGAFVVRTPLELDAIQELYHAAKEVHSQFNRVTETIVPVPLDPNGVLTVVLYGSRDDYALYQPLLYDLDSNNGGIYIEQTGTFYTYQRSSLESTYTLEELFRHEYVHYLVGRYLIEDFWGEAPIYAGDRMVWFDEGLAEFLCWSTRDRGIKDRRKLLEQVKDDPSRMSIDEILSARYGNFEFYRYAALFFSYLYRLELGTLRALIHHSHNSNIAEFDVLVSAMRQNAVLEANFQTYIDTLIANEDNLDDPFTVFPPQTDLDSNDISQIQADFRKTRLGYLGNCSVAAIELNSRFSCRGTLSGVAQTAPPNLDVVWLNFNKGLDEIIAQASLYSTLNNFNAMTCRFGSIQISLTADQTRYYPLADYYCDGPLGQGVFSLLPFEEQVEADFHSTRLGVNTTCMLTSPTQVDCNSGLSTTTHPASDDDVLLEAELRANRVELQNQVYAIRPSYYRDFNCTLDPGFYVVDWPDDQKYMVGNASCIVRFETH